MHVNESLFLSFIYSFRAFSSLEFFSYVGFSFLKEGRSEF